MRNTLAAVVWDVVLVKYTELSLSNNASLTISTSTNCPPYPNPFVAGSSVNTAKKFRCRFASVNGVA